jgi:5'-3' exonuclease
VLADQYVLPAESGFMDLEGTPDAAEHAKDAALQVLEDAFKHKYYRAKFGENAENMDFLEDLCSNYVQGTVYTCVVIR